MKGTWSGEKAKWQQEPQRYGQHEDGIEYNTYVVSWNFIEVVLLTKITK